MYSEFLSVIGRFNESRVERERKNHGKKRPYSFSRSFHIAFMRRQYSSDRCSACRFSSSARCFSSSVGLSMLSIVTFPALGCLVSEGLDSLSEESISGSGELGEGQGDDDMVATSREWWILRDEVAGRGGLQRKRVRKGDHERRR